jgi:hypothetical protein
MSITLGIYDLFSYLIPGVFYLFVVNEFLRSIGSKYFVMDAWIQQVQSSSFALLIILLLGGYVVGHILDPLSQRFFNFFYRLGGRITPPVKGLKMMKERHLELNIQFEPKDWDILLALIRQRNLEMAQVLDKFQADSKMLRNIAFGLLILVSTQIISFVSTNEISILLNVLGELFLFYFAISKSNQFHLWFFEDTFKASLEYGSSLKKVIEYSKENSKKENKSKSIVGKKNTRS